MTTRKLLQLGLVALSATTLAACSFGGAPKKDIAIKTEQSSSVATATKEVKEGSEHEANVEKDLGIFLGAMLTDSERGFSRLYGDSFERWASQGDETSTKKWVEETGLTPEENYSATLHDAKLTPSDIYKSWLVARRGVIRKLPDDYKIKDIEVDGDTATATIEVKGINALELAGRVRTAKARVLTDDWVLIVNSSDDQELKKRDQLINFYVLEGMMRNEFADLEHEFSEVPVSEPVTLELNLIKDRSGNWVVEFEDYKAFQSDLFVSDQGYQSESSSVTSNPDED